MGELLGRYLVSGLRDTEALRERIAQTATTRGGISRGIPTRAILRKAKPRTPHSYRISRQGKTVGEIVC